MFTPNVAQSQMKASESPTSRLTPQRLTPVGHRPGHDSVEQVLFLQRTIGNQATLGLMAHELTDVVQQSHLLPSISLAARGLVVTSGVLSAPPLQRQGATSVGLSAPDPGAFAAADPEAARMLRTVLASSGGPTIPTGKALPAGSLPAGGKITLTFGIDTTLSALGITKTTSVSSPDTASGVVGITIFFNSNSATQQTWFHEFQHALIEISKALVQSAGPGASTPTGAAMTSSRTAGRYWADLAVAKGLPESQMVVRDYRTIVGAARTAGSAGGHSVNALSDADVIEHVVNERRAKLEENAFVTANKRGRRSTVGLPAFLYDELIVPIRAQLSAAEQATFDASVSRLTLRGDLEASLSKLLSKL